MSLVAHRDFLKYQLDIDLICWDLYFFFYLAESSCNTVNSILLEVEAKVVSVLALKLRALRIHC